ncbi:HigA family addiction module antitoxin [Pseudoduganella sp. LjRoot289]|uniref:HigA family addiction module antitoxin n=1 Tax=Pseudoduganella sp. LjRoot289 TaxID=3342314 RepID=UPI003ECD3D8B
MTINRTQLHEIDFSDVATGNLIPSLAPGQILKSEFLDPLQISQYRLAKLLDIPAQRIGAIVASKRAITADTDLRLCHFFNLTDGFFLRLQAQYDLEAARAGLRHTLAKMQRYTDLPEQAA